MKLNRIIYRIKEKLNLINPEYEFAKRFKKLSKEEQIEAIDLLRSVALNEGRRHNDESKNCKTTSKT